MDEILKCERNSNERYQAVFSLGTVYFDVETGFDSFRVFVSRSLTIKMQAWKLNSVPNHLCWNPPSRNFLCFYLSVGNIERGKTKYEEKNVIFCSGHNQGRKAVVLPHTRYWSQCSFRLVKTKKVLVIFFFLSWWWADNDSVTQLSDVILLFSRIITKVNGLRKWRRQIGKTK